jgi:transcriptional regulator with XRE-family HTH domain
MGKGRREKPKLLGNKLREIRTRFGLSQNAMLKRLGLDTDFSRAELSAYERGVREPPLRVLLSYSQVARVWINVLVDDQLDLPYTLNHKDMHGGVKPRRTSASR